MSMTQIDDYFALISNVRIPSRTKFPDGIFEIPFNRMMVCMHML
jgi:hypothetical protein